MVSLPQAKLRAAADLTSGRKGARAASELGDSVGSRSAVSAGGPVNVFSLAAAEDIEVVQVASLSEAGRIEWTSGGLRIALRKGDGPQRQRFTLAHELAHHLIFGVEREGTRTHSREEERRCDKFASALLMPEDRFRTLLRHHRNLPRLSAARELASQFDVSLQAAVARLDDLALMGPDSILLVCADREDGNYMVQSAAYDRSTYAHLERLTTKSLGIEDALAPERYLRMRLPRRQGRSPQVSPWLRHAVVTSLPLRGDRRQVLLELDMGSPSLWRRFPARTTEVRQEVIETR